MIFLFKMEMRQLILDATILAVGLRPATKTHCWTTRLSTPGPRDGAVGPAGRNTGSGQLELIFRDLAAKKYI